MKAAVVARPGADVSGFLAAISVGLEKNSVGVTLTDNELDARRHDFAVCWGWRRGRALQQLGLNVLVAERGYIGDRFRWTSLAWNGLNGRGDFCLGHIPPLDPARRAIMVDTFKPWRSGRGDKIVIMGQVPGDESLQGRDLGPWYLAQAKAASERFRLPVVLRPHPIAMQRKLHVRSGVPEIVASLDETLAQAAVVVTFNSNSGTDALMAGVPTVATDPGSMAWGIAAPSIDAIRIPTPEPDGRTRWAARVAWSQWTPEELAAGLWWHRMKAGIEDGRQLLDRPQECAAAGRR
jgi:hypothetical protein